MNDITVSYEEKRTGEGPPVVYAFLNHIHIANIHYSLLDDQFYIIKWLIGGLKQETMRADKLKNAKELIELSLSQWLFKAGLIERT